MLIEAEVSSRELLKRLLEQHSIEYILQTIAEEIDHPEPEEVSKALTKMFWDGIRGENE